MSVNNHHLFIIFVYAKIKKGLIEKNCSQIYCKDDELYPHDYIASLDLSAYASFFDKDEQEQYLATFINEKHSDKNEGILLRNAFEEPVKIMEERMCNSVKAKITPQNGINMSGNNITIINQKNLNQFIFYRMW